MRSVIVTDASVQISGAGAIELGVGGGVLSGNLSGASKIDYHGTVSEENINISGFGFVNKAD